MATAWASAGRGARQLSRPGFGGRHDDELIADFEQRLGQLLQQQQKASSSSAREGGAVAVAAGNSADAGFEGSVENTGKRNDDENDGDDGNVEITVLPSAAYHSTPRVPQVPPNDSSSIALRSADQHTAVGHDNLQRVGAEARKDTESDGQQDSSDGAESESNVEGSTTPADGHSDIRQTLSRVQAYNERQKLRATFLFLARLRKAVADASADLRAARTVFLHSTTAGHRYADLSIDLQRQIEELKQIKIDNAKAHAADMERLQRSIKQADMRLRLKHYETRVKRDRRFIKRYVQEVSLEVARSTEEPILSKATERLDAKVKNDVDRVRLRCREYFGELVPHLVAGPDSDASSSTSAASTPSASRQSKFRDLVRPGINSPLPWRVAVRRYEEQCNAEESNDKNVLRRTHALVQNPKPDLSAVEVDLDNTATVLWLISHDYSAQRQHVASLGVLRASLRQGEDICKAMFFPVLQQKLYDRIDIRQGFVVSAHSHEAAPSSGALMPTAAVGGASDATPHDVLLRQHCAASNQLLHWILAVNSAMVDATEEERLDSNSEIIGPVLVASAGRGRRKTKLIRRSSAPRSRVHGLKQRASCQSKSALHGRRSHRRLEEAEEDKWHSQHLLTTFWERLRVAAAMAFEGLPLEWWVYTDGSGRGGASAPSAGSLQAPTGRPWSPHAVSGSGGHYFHYLAEHRHRLHAEQAKLEKRREASRQAVRAGRCGMQRYNTSSTVHDGESLQSAQPIDHDHELLMEARSCLDCVRQCFLFLRSVRVRFL
eukprot:INCI2729.4.p1 GENE.INCI2729.4~~INCI2729.4.p1  ORF type:complete len:775 (+),score=138.16 INCI2729.4:118-2442(+)